MESKFKREEGKCWVVTVKECTVKLGNEDEESPKGCVSCEMLNWLCFDTVEEANKEWLEHNK